MRAVSPGMTVYSMRCSGAIAWCGAETMDDFYATLLMFSKMDAPGPGGLAAVTDSGGQRSVLLDEAERIGLPLAQFSDQTRGRLRQVLAPDLPDDNPVDLWGGEENLIEHIETCIEIALDDPDTALATVFTELGAADTDIFVHSFASAAINTARVAQKPVLAVTFSSRHFHPRNIRMLDDAGLVVLDGVRAGLAAIKHLFDRRERKRRAAPDFAGLPAGIPPLVSAALDGGEIEALALLNAAGIETVDCFSAASVEDVHEAMAKISGPVALKTAVGQIHKSEVGGVVLSLKSVEEVLKVYADMAPRLGPEVTVAAMAPDGVEVAFGAIAKTPFGPAIMFGAGGVLVEVLDDVTFELAPIDQAIARDMIARTETSKLLEGVRGKPACDVDALCDALVCFSHLVAAMADEISEIDVNPVIVSEVGCVAVDAVVRGRSAIDN